MPSGIGSDLSAYSATTTAQEVRMLKHGSKEMKARVEPNGKHNDQCDQIGRFIGPWTHV